VKDPCQLSFFRIDWSFLSFIGKDFVLHSSGKVAVQQLSILSLEMHLVVPLCPSHLVPTANNFRDRGKQMGILSWIILGLVAGAIAKLLMPGRDPGGWIVTMLLGIAGAIVGGWIGSMLWGSPGATGVNLSSIGLAVLGAIVLLAIYRMIVGRRRTDMIDRTGRRAA
jgi:uncharacterized membrane protein YeaQ/YmgE (transglycosylase-associated protein family)